MSTIRLLLSVCLAASLAPLVAAQPVSVDPGEEAEREHEREMVKSDDERAADAERGLETKTAPRTPSPTLSAYARHVMSFEPRRLSPGARGEVKVVVVFHRVAGVVSGAEFKLVAESVQGPVRLGEFTVSEPDRGLVQPKFVGQSVWEDTAVFSVPIFVDDRAEFGKYPVSLTLTAELTDGKTGQALGIRTSPVSAQLEIGDPIPTPPKPGRSTDDGAHEVAAPAAIPPVAVEQPSSDVKDTDVKDADVKDAAAALPFSSPAQDEGVRNDGATVPQEETESRWMLITASGALLALVGVLVLARGRRSRVA